MFKLKPNPTFTYDVTIARPDGEGDNVIEFVFKHKGRKALKTFFDSLGTGDNARPDDEALLELIADWGKTDGKFSPEALSELLDDYPTAAKAIFEGYNKGLFEGKAKNS